MSVDKNAKFFMPPSCPRFQLAAKNTMLMLRDINAVMVFLQERLLPTHECCELQERLIRTVQMGKENEDSHWYLSDYRVDYIRSDSHKRPNKVFVIAVCKMQKRQGSTLAPAEKLAISTWRTNPWLPVLTNNNGNGLSLANAAMGRESQRNPMPAVMMIMFLIMSLVVLPKLSGCGQWPSISSQKPAMECTLLCSKQSCFSISTSLCGMN
jgi:hypothetical protein